MALTEKEKMAENEKNESGATRYVAPRLLIYGSVKQLTASGTQGGTENPFNGDPQPRDKP